jgi:hypothetical protein
VSERTEVDLGELAAAFPSSLADDVAAVAAAVPDATWESASAFGVVVGTETLAIPYRIYRPEPDLAVERELSPLQQTVLASFYTRHHDGRVRQRRVEAIIASDAEWVVPFVIHLVGEYVIEIVRAIQDALGDLDPADARREPYRRFVMANPALLDLVAARAMSYWAEYYRGQFPRWDASPNRDDYPGLAVVRLLRSLGGTT